MLPTADRARIKRLSDDFVGGGADHFAFQALTVIQHLVFPRQPKKFERTARLPFEVCDGIFIADLKPGRGNHLPQLAPDGHIISESTSRPLKAEEADAIWVQRQVLHETTDYDIARVAQRHEHFCFGEKPQETRKDQCQGRILVHVQSLADRLIQRSGHIRQVALA